MNALFSLLGDREWFWRTRAKLRRWTFSIRARVFNFQQSARERKTETGIFAQLLRAVGWQLIGAFMIVAALHWLDARLRPWFVRWEWEIPTDDSYAALLTTIAGIGGVFIGLYYAALSAVNGAIYARVPNNIRDLLAHDRTGNFYINFLAILTFSCVLLVASHVVGWGSVQSAAFVAALFVGVGILSFAQLGRQAFNFFDPTSLSGTVIEQLIRSVKMAAHSDKSFQRHAHRLAAHGVSVLDTLSDICAKEPHLRGEPYAQFCRAVVQFLLFYQVSRCQIPTASLWFEQKHVHKEWHAYNSTANMFHVVGMPLQPEIIRDVNWLDNALLPVVRQCLRGNLADKKWGIARGLLADYGRYPELLAALRQVESAAAVVRTDGAIVLGQILPPSKEIAASEQAGEAGIIEQVAALPERVLIGYCNKLRGVKKEFLSGMVGEIAWHRRDGIYQLQFPPHLLSCLETLRVQLNFERQAEGKIITPPWYQAEVVAREESEHFAANAKVLLEDFPALLSEWGKTAEQSKRLWARAMIVGAEWRYHVLLGERLAELKEAHDSVTGNRRVEGMKWGSVDFSAGEKKRAERGKEIIRRMSTLAPMLLLVPRPEWSPDYPGQFMRCIGDAVMDALIDNDVETLRPAFASYAFTCFQQFERARQKIESPDWRGIEQLRGAFAPLRDLLCLSGHARLMSELHQSPALWEAVVGVWDDLLPEDKDSPKATDSNSGIAAPKMLVAMLRDSERTLRPGAGEEFRFAWQRKAAQKLAQVPRKMEACAGGWDERIHGRFGIFPDIPEDTVDHPSKLVRHFAESRLWGGHGGEDIFVLYYLRARADCEGVDFKEWDDLGRSIERA